MSKDTEKEKTFNAYLKSAGTIPKSKLAKLYGVSPGTVRKWAKNENWDGMIDTLVCQKRKNLSVSNAKSVSSFLPQETAKIIETIENMSGAEILWQNILLQYAAIIRAQKLLDVENKIVQVKKREALASDTDAKEWENFTPWERCKIYLDTQSKAMNALTAMLKKYEDYKHQGLANEELSAKIDFIRSKAQAMAENSDTIITVISEIPEKEDG